MTGTKWQFKGLHVLISLENIIHLHSRKETAEQRKKERITEEKIEKKNKRR